MVRMAEKNQDDLEEGTRKNEKAQLRREFWGRFIEASSKRTHLYSNPSPDGGPYLRAASGVPGVAFPLAATNNSCRAEVWIGRASEEENRFIFDRLRERREQLEKTFGEQLTWNAAEGRKSYKIEIAREGDVYNIEQWPEMIEFLADRSARLEKTFRPFLQEINLQLETGDSK